MYQKKIFNSKYDCLIRGVNKVKVSKNLGGRVFSVVFSGQRTLAVCACMALCACVCGGGGGLLSCLSPESAEVINDTRVD